MILSKKHGLNPSLDICFWCGEEKGIALLGKIGGRNQDLKAPPKVITNYEPCDKCKEQMESGITIMEVCENSVVENLKPIGKNDMGQSVFPTGKFVVVKEDSFNRIFQDKLDSLHGSKKMIMHQDEFKRLFSQEKENNLLEPECV